jgi:YidC/Oxa1 family membrane protein insertase
MQQMQRTILWVVFSVSLLFLWDNWQRYNGKPPLFGPQPAPSQAEGKPATTASPQATAANTQAMPPAKADASIPTAPTTQVANGSAAAVVPPNGANATQAAAAPKAPALKLSNDVLAIDIDQTGAQVVRAELLKHKAFAGDSGSVSTNLVLLHDLPGKVYIAQSGLIGAAQGSSYPTHRSQFTVVDGPRKIDGGAVQMRLSAQDGGLKLVRSYTLKPGSYVVEVADEIINEGEAPARPTLYMQLTRDGNKPPGESHFYSTYTGPVVYTEEKKFQKVDFSDIEKGKPDHVKSASDGWVGIIQHYFLSAWLPTDKAPREFFTRKIETNLYAAGALQPLGELAPKASKTVQTRLLVAPQDQRMLETVAPGLDLSVDYGWLTAVAKPIFWLLQFLHGIVGNWGWAIVLLTIVIKTIFFPLQAASYRSMARMKAVTPRLQAMRERYGNDRVKMNQAMMDLYREEKINPLGGCLPIVVQIPVFIALYWVLLASVEMRNAPWLGWIQDLAAPDTLFGTIPFIDMPFGLLPLIMAGTMFIQVKLNPTPPDPVQAKVMTIMPIIFSFMFFSFPSGLVLYWLVNNIYSIAQQWTITRTIGKASEKQGSKKA